MDLALSHHFEASVVFNSVRTSGRPVRIKSTANTVNKDAVAVGTQRLNLRRCPKHLPVTPRVQASLSWHLTTTVSTPPAGLSMTAIKEVWVPKHDTRNRRSCLCRWCEAVSLHLQHGSLIPWHGHQPLPSAIRGWQPCSVHTL